MPNISANFSSDSTSKETVGSLNKEQMRSIMEDVVSANQGRNTQRQMLNQDIAAIHDNDTKMLHKHCVHPSYEQLSFDELGKIYTNISRRKILSKVNDCP